MEEVFGGDSSDKSRLGYPPWHRFSGHKSLWQPCEKKKKVSPLSAKQTFTGQAMDPRSDPGSSERGRSQINTKKKYFLITP
jgi:hypothetical protein